MVISQALRFVATTGSAEPLSIKRILGSHAPLFFAFTVMTASVVLHAATEPSTSFHIEKIGKDVYAVISDDPLGIANHSNSVFIVGEDDVVVVDSQFTLQRTRDVLSAIREITNKPVSAVINTHWHDDHTFGNQVYREVFPAVEIIAHENTDADMASIGVQNRVGQVAGGREALAMFRDAITKRTSLDGTPMSESEVAAYQSTITIVEEYLDDNSDFILTPPTITFSEHLTLMQGDRAIDIRSFGHGVTRGDSIVWLSKEGVLVAGDLVDNPVPFSYGANVNAWMAALKSISDLRPSVIVPGHGNVLRDDKHVRRLYDLLASIVVQTRAAALRRETVEEIRKNIDISEFRQSMAGDNKMLRFLFDEFFLPGAVNSAFDLQGQDQKGQ